MKKELPYTPQEIDNLTRGELVEFILDESGDEFETKTDLVQLAIESLSELKLRAKNVLDYLASQEDEEDKTRTFTIPVVRVGYACRDIEVVAETLEEAEELALEEAGNESFSEHTSDYFVEDENPNEKVIVYLSPDYSNDLSWDGIEERNELILKHSESQVYSLKAFETLFNGETISDLGYIVVVTRGQAKEWKK